MTSREVGALFRVKINTVNTWATQGRLTSIRTLGGHRRYLEAEVRRLYAENTREIPAPSPPT